MQAFQIVNQVGPLPIITQFDPPLNGPMLLVVTGSLWSSSPDSLLTLNAVVDGAEVGSVTIWSNNSSTHRALPALFANLNLGDGTHTLNLTAGGNGVQSDLNDTFYAAILY